MGITSKEKSKFRASKKWKDFRRKLMEERGAVCELCGTKYSGKRRRMIQVHHLDPDNYTDLRPEKFVLLCSLDHTLVERISKKILSKNIELPNKSVWLLLLERFLPFKPRKKLQEEVKNGS